MKENYKLIVGQNLQEARKACNITQTQIAEELNMAQTQYSRYERGAVELDYFKIIYLCKRFEITPNDLFNF